MLCFPSLIDKICIRDSIDEVKALEKKLLEVRAKQIREKRRKVEDALLASLSEIESQYATCISTIEKARKDSDKMSQEIKSLKAETEGNFISLDLTWFVFSVFCAAFGVQLEITLKAYHRDHLVNLTKQHKVFLLCSVWHCFD